MATAEEILAGAAETIPDADVNNKVIRIDSNLRTMSIPAEFGPLGVESDDDVNKVQFEIPRYYGGIDLSTFEVRINYMNANGDGDIYDVIDLNIIEDNLVFSWLVGSLALAYKGDVKFIVCFKKLNEDFTVSKEFNTTLASLPVLEGLEPSKHLIDVYPDIIERMLRYMEAPISSEQIYTAVENYLKNNPIISEHNLSKEAHEDIRQLILGLTNRLNALANSDDTTLDQLSEIVAYIKNNKGLIDTITTGKVSTSDIVDNLVTNVGTKVLSAAQGVALKVMIDGAVSTLSEQMVNYRTVVNLLDNTDFEIAQAGYGGKHGSAIYAADRWVQNDNTARTYTKVTHNGHGALKCTSETRIQQKLYLTDGMPYTAAFLINDRLYLHAFTTNKGSHGLGNVWVNYQSDGTYMFVISGVPANGIISEPVLYPGTYAAETLPPYVPKGNAVELAECQRWYNKGRASVATNQSGYATVFFPMTMRKIPNVAVSEGMANFVSEDAFVLVASADNVIDLSYEAIAEL